MSSRVSSETVLTAAQQKKENELRAFERERGLLLVPFEFILFCIVVISLLSYIVLRVTFIKTIGELDLVIATVTIAFCVVSSICITLKRNA
jgi:hypothetical protein